MSLSASLTKFFSEYAGNFTAKALPILVGVSGGPDSVALLHALVQFQASSQFNLEIHIAHLNHCLRGNAADADADFVMQLAQSLNLPYHSASFEVEVYANKYKLSIETAARAVRYAFLAHIMTSQQIGLLLLAHTADDQAETVLLHLLRGSGSHGLTGMTAIAPLPLPTTPPAFEYDAAFIRTAQVGRPLLEVERSAIEEYCTAYNLQPRFDQTNIDTSYLRNRIRLDLLPHLEREYKPGFKKNLTRLASILQADEQFLAGLAGLAFEKLATTRAFTIEFSIKAFKLEHLAMQARLIRLAYQKLNGSGENLEALHIQLIIQAVQSNAPGWTLELPGGIVVRKTSIYLYISTPAKILATQPQLPVDVDSLPLKVNNKATLALANGWLIQAILFDKTTNASLNKADSFTAWLDAAKVGPTLEVRIRQPGDKFQPLGAPGHRKLQDVLLDAKIPKEARPRWPIVVTGGASEQIVWVAGCSIADPFKVTDQSQQILELKLASY